MLEDTNSDATAEVEEIVVTKELVYPSFSSYRSWQPRYPGLLGRSSTSSRPTPSWTWPRAMTPQEDLLGNVAPSRNGEAAAAIVAAGVGCAVFGILVVLVALSTAIETLLTFYAPVGSLSGKSIVAVGVWLISWFALHRAWKDKHLDQRKTFTAAAILVGLGVLGTFPPFYEALHQILS